MGSMFREFERAGHTCTTFYEVSGFISDGAFSTLSDGYGFLLRTLDDPFMK